METLAQFRFQLRCFLHFSEMQAEHFGVAPQHYQLMQVIATPPPGEAVSISYLAGRMVLRHNSTVELVDRAERAGLVARVQDERDLRRTIVVLTPQGRDVLERMMTAHLHELQGQTGAQLLHSLSEVRRLAGESKPYVVPARSA